MVKPENPFFARALVNRLWGHFLGRGLFQEVDDQRDTNPPSNPELLDALAKEFVAKKFDLKHIIRTMLTSRVYQLSSTPTEHNKDDRQNFARYYARRMPAEVFLDAVNQATGSKAGFSGVGAPFVTNVSTRRLVAVSSTPGFLSMPCATYSCIVPRQRLVSAPSL